MTRLHLQLFLQRQGWDTKKQKSTGKNYSIGIVFFQNWQDDLAWKKPGLKTGAAYSFLLSQSLYFLFFMFLLTCWLEFLIFSFFSLICLLACSVRCLTTCVLILWHLKQTPEYFLNTWSLFWCTEVLHFFDVLTLRLFVLKQITNV